MALQVTDDPREILFSGYQAEVIEIAHGVRRAVLLHLAIFQREKIDDGAVIDAHGGKTHLAFLELLYALPLETQHPGIEGERAVDISHVENDVVQPGDLYRVQISPPP